MTDPDWLETKATEIVDRVTKGGPRGILIEYVHAILEATKCRGRMQGIKELSTAIIKPKELT
jgi:hypothetical protein